VSEEEGWSDMREWSKAAINEEWKEEVHNVVAAAKQQSMLLLVPIRGKKNKRMEGEGGGKYIFVCSLCLCNVCKKVAIRQSAKCGVIIIT
jgi:hypothetical protein